MRIIHIAFLVAALALCACSPVRETTAYFRPTTLERFEPLPRNAEIPILANVPPGTKYKVIGEFHFQSTRNWPFFVKSMAYNARRNGANAVIIRDSWAQSFRDVVVVPPQTDWVPVTTFHHTSTRGSTSARTIWVPEFRPGYSFPVLRTLSGVQAEMVRINDGQPLNP